MGNDAVVYKREYNTCYPSRPSEPVVFVNVVLPSPPLCFIYRKHACYDVKIETLEMKLLFYCSLRSWLNP